ncbi:DUF5937 family protein [Nonomuraea sp. NPDC050556]|uniref:ArsR/SmtB family transcription factor n=1 Tax=Nonomuraea sp. NPDC050556 TaxID=3364369 RepID=UPI00379080F7
MEAELAFSTGDLAHTRFSVSPMWEVVTSVRTLLTTPTPSLHRPWVEQVLPRVRSTGLGLLAKLIPPTGYLPDFLTPTPKTAFPTLDSELAAIAATPASVIRTELAVLDMDLSDVDLSHLTAEIETYWELALAPYWARIRTVLEADVFHRARQVAEHGSAHLLNDLHASVRWDNDTLLLVRRQCAIVRDRPGSGLILIPSIFAWPHVLTRSVAPDPPQLAYPARAVGTVWEKRSGTDNTAIAAVIGKSRALLLAELESPASTTQLAQRAGLSAAGVSQHLTALRDAGLVTAHRAGHSVLYARTAIADSLLTA